MVFNEIVSDLKDGAAMFRAFGNPTRLRIFEFLRDCCCSVAVDEQGDVSPVEGATVGNGRLLIASATAKTMTLKP